MATYRNRDNQFKLNNKVLGKDVYTWAPNFSESTETTFYYGGDRPEMDPGILDMDMTFTCHNRDNDEAAEYVYGLMFADPANRTGIVFEWTPATEETARKFYVTIHDIVPSGGNAGDRSGFTFGIHIDKPYTTTGGA